MRREISEEKSLRVRIVRRGREEEKSMKIKISGNEKSRKDKCKRGTGKELRGKDEKERDRRPEKEKE